ncbi:hypothetical protein RE9414_35440 [Prescottella equi]|nr:hypothetical protein RE9414_35440 [Prescottella equi]
MAGLPELVCSSQCLNRNIEVARAKLPTILDGKGVVMQLPLHCKLMFEIQACSSLGVQNATKSNQSAHDGKGSSKYRRNWLRQPPRVRCDVLIRYRLNWHRFLGEPQHR